MTWCIEKVGVPKCKFENREKPKEMQHFTSSTFRTGECALLCQLESPYSTFSAKVKVPLNCSQYRVILTKGAHLF